LAVPVGRVAVTSSRPESIYNVNR